MSRHSHHNHTIIIVIIISRFLTSLASSEPIQKRIYLKPQGPQNTYYYIVIVIVAGTKMHEREMKLR